MGIFDALTTAVAGLQAQSFALQNISGNIANSQTTGYKETDTSFQDLVSAAAVGQQTSGGVIAGSVATNTVQGAIQSTTVSTDMAINGDGFFVVAQPTGFTDNQPNFNGVNDFTRAGDFQMNANGNLVNGAGYYLMGIPVNATTGNPEGSVPQVLQFNNNFVPAQETTQIQYQANLPSSPPALLNESSFESNPRCAGGADRRHRRNALAGRGRERNRDGRHSHQRHGADQRRHLFGERRRQYDELHRGRDFHPRRSDERDQQRHRERACRSDRRGNSSSPAQRPPHRSPSAAPPPPSPRSGSAPDTRLSRRPIC